MAVEIVPLNPDRLPDLATLFAQGGDPRYCWCAWFRVRGSFFSNATVTDHRAVLEKATDAGAEIGQPPGLVAYDGDELVGWVSVGPRSDYERLTHSKVLAPVDDTPVWSIVCFVVGKRSRGQGIARAMLDAAIGFAREHGATTLEAYPVDVPAGTRIDDGTVFKGTLAMFEAAGFHEVARRQWNATTPIRPIVRLSLAP